MPTINKERCPTCGQSVNTRQISLFKGMVVALFEVYKWCREKNRHEFTRKDIKHLFKSENITARFGDWVLFGGLVYKKEKAHYGLNIQRCEDFFSGKLAIPTIITKNPITGELKKFQERTIKQTPRLVSLLDEYGDYVVKYGEVSGKLF